MFAEQYKTIFLLLLIFLGSILAVNYAPEQETIDTPAAAEPSAEHFALGYSKIQMDQLGRADSKLTADHAANYSGSEGTKLINPVMTVYKKTTPPWVIRSKTGHVSPDGNKISMNGEVFIDRVAAENVREINVKTSNLRLLPKQNYAETDDWAEMVSGLERISGVGMTLYYQDPLYIKLLANVKGQHEYK
ncbi:MAG: LPS export ABC transporter periplasmic protein LptC [Gammaproteobacteria bacterium]|jgi:lipopolysaccharide export system protein LptC|nr:LPS export ABC transporter periplasmic protein LptC [Gammaproteobacteria bacterium]MBT4145523.1 LPS export ABC transporter periplasmic protein LptC [Gammaproteobacteria bacterium]MBT5221879.1 LPS export ABC transporter periplasmic protein LptC [Gammaproteobacteria bacterium]MBT5824905.1 LPS export ABC transporter periplasmic protein LptC [Gammaproteobacteria bacterium]MBT5967313.1 LPS export ABC transporter periplasmic protein LptC [Gammaproteobacteria bacterium]